METGKYHHSSMESQRLHDGFYYGGSMDRRPTAAPVSRMQAPPPVHYILEPQETDVMFGRGVPIQTHPGNRQLHLIADSYKNQYRDARNDVKLEIVASVVSRVHAYGGRFLKSTKIMDEQTGVAKKYWFEVSDAEAREKCRHTIRTRMLKADNGEEGQDEAPEKEAGTSSPPPAKKNEEQTAPVTPVRADTPTLSNDQDIPKKRLTQTLHRVVSQESNKRNLSPCTPRLEGQRNSGMEGPRTPGMEGPRTLSADLPFTPTMDLPFPSSMGRVDCDESFGRRPDYYNRSSSNGSPYGSQGRMGLDGHRNSSFFSDMRRSSVSSLPSDQPSYGSRGRDMITPPRSSFPSATPSAPWMDRRRRSFLESMSLTEEENMLRSRLAEIQEVRDTAAFLYARRRASMMG